MAAVTTYTGQGLQPVYPGESHQQPVNLVPSGTFAAGLVLGELTSTPGTFKAYASGNSDGSQVPKCILAYSATTDGSGDITSIGGEWGNTFKSVPAFTVGTFSTADLTGLDANAVTVLAGHLESGTISAGVIHIG